MAIRCRTAALFLPLAVIACNVSPKETEALPQDATAKKKDAWLQIMAEVGDERNVVRDLLTSTPQGDLDQVANAAEKAARLMRSGYGENEHKRIPNFADMSRDCESWLLEVATEARQGHGELALAAFQAGRSNCKTCHDAAGAGW
ncbi:MAG: hypothetical protein VYE77_03905 [Planctomycetota bacterium]|nr:hypothetical protein [Planctomycetota bacterium]